MGDLFSTAEARACGIGTQELRGPRWQPVSYGLHRRAGTESDLLGRCRDLTSVLPEGAAFAGLTAAAIYRMWIPRLPRWLPVLAALAPGTDRPERAGLYVFRSRAGLPRPWSVAGVPVVAPAVCIGQLAEDLGVVDLVAAIDGAEQLRLCTGLDIVDAIRSRQRGLPRLRRALELSCGASESPWESYLRVLHTTSGVAVEAQAVIEDPVGRFLARADLRIKGTRRLAEYDGASHRDRTRHESDLEREKALARNGWERYGYIAREIVQRPDRIVRDAEEALGWAHRPQRLADWIVLAQQSSLTDEGRVRLHHRLHRFARPLRGRVH